MLPPSGLVLLLPMELEVELLDSAARAVADEIGVSCAAVLAVLLSVVVV